jgi:2-oxoglutarate dehydrogenase E1 component
MGPGTKFQPLIADPVDAKANKNVTRLIFCSGKIYYDLSGRIQKEKIHHVRLVRLEQLYPLPKPEMESLLKEYPKAEKIWLQEEPANMGAWQFICAQLPDVGFRLISRKAAASPATGFKKSHEENQERIIVEAIKP